MEVRARYIQEPGFHFRTSISTYSWSESCPGTGPTNTTPGRLPSCIGELVVLPLMLRYADADVIWVWPHIRYRLRIKFEMLSRLAPRTWGWWITVATWRWTHSPARTLVRSRGRSQSATWSTQVVRNSGWGIYERWVNIKKFPWHAHDAFRSSSDQVRGWRLSLVIMALTKELPEIDNNE